MGDDTRSGRPVATEGDRDQHLAELLSRAAERLQLGNSVSTLTPDDDQDGRVLSALLPTVQNLFALRHDVLNEDPGEYNSTDSFRGLQESRIGDYRLMRELGRGGMGVVYEAEQVNLGRRVALKVLSATNRPDDRRRQRFELESRAAAGLRHPNIVPVYSAGQDGGVFYYAMQLIDGCSLSELIARAGTRDPDPSDTPPIPPVSTSEYYRFAARLVAEAAQALDYAHLLGVVHRDVKPGNLMLDRSGWLWAMDFGLAATLQAGDLTATGDRVGTVRYMSPEQATGRRGLIDQRTDIYSLGLTLYELLALQPAFEGGVDDLIRRVTSGPPPIRGFAPNVPVELVTVIQKAVEPDPADRYQTAQEMADDLARFLAGVPVRARPPGLAKKARRWAARNRLMFALAAAAMVCVAAIATASLWFTSQALTQERAARAEEQARIREGHAIVQSTLLRVAGDRAIRDPAFEPLREEFIDKGARYLERFIEDYRDDPAFEPELACSVAQLAEMRQAQHRPADAVPLYEDAATRYDRLAERSAEPHRSAYRQRAELVRRAVVGPTGSGPR